MTLPEREPPTKQWCPRTGGRTQPLTLAAMSLGFVVVQLDVTIVNVALRRIGESVGGGVAGLQWVVNAYSVVFASLILTAGAAGDRFGAKRVFIAGCDLRACLLGCRNSSQSGFAGFGTRPPGTWRGHSSALFSGITKSCLRHGRSTHECYRSLGCGSQCGAGGRTCCRRFADRRHRLA